MDDDDGAVGDDAEEKVEIEVELVVAVMVAVDAADAAGVVERRQQSCRTDVDSGERESWESWAKDEEERIPEVQPRGGLG
jgi:hypothetical protein